MPLVSQDCEIEDRKDELSHLNRQMRETILRRSAVAERTRSIRLLVGSATTCWLWLANRISTGSQPKHTPRQGVTLYPLRKSVIAGYISETPGGLRPPVKLFICHATVL